MTRWMLLGLILFVGAGALATFLTGWPSTTLAAAIFGGVLALAGMTAGAVLGAYLAPPD